MEKQLKFSIYFGVFVLVLFVLGIIILFYQNRSVLLGKTNPLLEKEEIKDVSKQFTNLYNQNKFIEVNQLLDSQLSNNPNDFTLLLQKAQALAQEASLTFKEKELGTQARTYAQKALDLDPNNVQALTLIGYTYEIQEDYVNAHKFYNMALKIEPDNADTLAQKGHAYDLQGEMNLARNFYERALSIDPENEVFMVGYARLLVLMANFEEAEKIYELVLSKTKNSRLIAEINNNLGLMSETKNYNNQTENYFKEAIKADASYTGGYVGYAKELFKKAQNTEALSEKVTLIEQSFQNLKKALAINPNNSGASLQLALQFHAFKQDKEALSVLKNAYEKIDQDIGLNSKSKIYTRKIYQTLISEINNK